MHRAEATGHADAGHQPGAEAGTGSLASASTAQEPERDPGAKIDSQCSLGEARTCAEGELRQPLKCENGVWTRLTACNADERCETAIGPQQGQCVAVAVDCLGKPDNTEVCDDRAIRTCKALVLSAPRTCGKLRRCTMQDGQPTCVCADGAVDEGRGCQLTSSCGVNRGGCDQLTECSASGTGRVCSPCPPGFAGDGIMGCLPELASLDVEGGQLTPGFFAGTHSYQIKLPLLQQFITLTPRGPVEAQIEINGEPVASGKPWRSQLLTLGKHMIRVRLSAVSGHATDYDLMVERSGVQEGYVKAKVTDEIDHFGNSIALWEDTLAVGAMHEDGAAPGVNGDANNNSLTDSGAAYVFVRHGNVWSQEAYLKSDAPASNEFFGVSVALQGDTLAVSAPHSSPWGNTSGHSGKVFVFVRNAGKWTRQTVLSGDNGDDVDQFGSAMAISEDTLVIGAPYESSGARQSGAVYVYPRTPTGLGTPVKLKSNAPKAEEVMGWSVALDGDTLLAGATEDSGTNTSNGGAGAAYVFVRRSGTWSQQQRLVMPSPVDGTSFGLSVAVRGEIAAVGAPRADLVRTRPPGEVYLFERTGDKWNATDTLKATTPRDSDYFGASVRWAGETLVVGANGDASATRGVGASSDRTGAAFSGAVYLFGKQDDHWERTAFIKASNTHSYDAFGQQVAVYGDTLATGAFLESSASTGVNGSDTNSGRSESGAVYVFR